MARLPEFDDEMGRMAAEAEASGEVLRYVGTVDVQVRGRAGCLVRAGRAAAPHRCCSGAARHASDH